MGRAEDLIARISEGGESAIDSLIEDRQSEELFLDFKRSSDNGSGAHLSGDDRKNLAKSISGFGNSEGGIVVWGVDCRHSNPRGDVANGKVKIENVKRFKSLLEGAVSGATLPPHPNVEHTFVEDEDGAGFVVTSIPKSYLAPHQSVVGMQYYMRAGSDFLPVPHGVLAGMFGRVPQPKILPRWQMETPRLRSNRGAYFRAYLSLLNRSSAIAKNLFVTLVVAWPRGGSSIEIGPESIDRNTWLVGEFANRTQLISTVGVRLAPESMLEVLTLAAALRPPFSAQLKIDVVTGCSGAPLTRLIHVSSQDSIAEAYENFAMTEAKGDGRELLRVAFGDPAEST